MATAIAVIPNGHFIGSDEEHFPMENIVVSAEEPNDQQGWYQLSPGGVAA